jgi:hypothetical protein
MGLHDLEHEGGRDAGVEGVAAALQHRHPDRGAEPVRGRYHTESAEDFGPCREHEIRPVFRRSTRVREGVAFHVFFR